MFVLAGDATIIGEFLVGASVVLVIVAALVLTRRPLGLGSGDTLVTPSILLLLAVSLVGVIAWPSVRTAGLCSIEALGGANIGHAALLAFLGGLVGAVALRAVRSDTRKVAVTLLLAAGLLGVCLVLVMLDSAAYTVRWFPPSGDMFNCPYSEDTEIHRVWFLYPVWGSAVALLLLQASRAFRQSRRPDNENDATE
jgi:hypothetical protein